VWFRFTVPGANTQVTIDITTEASTTDDAHAKIYSGSCASLVELSCNQATACSPGCLNYVQGGLTGGSSYYLRVIFEGPSPPNPIFDVCIYKATTTLPIELLSFSAFPYSSKEVQVNWITSTETNNDYFSVERSTDGINFSPIGTVKGAGNSSTQKKYSWIDADPVVGKSYYRLKQTDFDGKFEIFNPVAVDFDPKNVEWFFVNPTIISSSDKINLELTNLPSGNNIAVHLYDMQGNSVYSNLISFDVNGKGIITTLNIPAHLSSGMYALSVSCGNRAGVKKIIVR